MTTHLSLVQFLAQQANRDIAGAAIAEATMDYDLNQDLVAHRKRNIRVHRNLENGTAMLLEDVTTEAGKETIEPTFVVAGTLVHANLPPILNKNQIPADVMRTSQDVSIMGADPAHFNDMVIAVEEIYDKFAAYFPEESLKRTEGQTVDGEFVLYFGTRYHSHHKAAKGESSLKLSRVVDPFGILEKAVGTRGKHLADNKVSFFARTDMGDGTKAKWEPIHPSRFRAGHTVQIEVAFRAVPTTNKASSRMVALLRSVALLDANLYKEWGRVNKPIISSSPQVRYKRSTIYDTPSDSDAVLRPAKRVKSSAEEEIAGSGRNREEEAQGDGPEDVTGEDMALDLGDLEM